MSESTLPEDFRDLEGWTDWCLETEKERSDRRQASSFEDVRAFYDAMLPRVEAALAYLDSFPMDAMPPNEWRLFLLTLSLAEVAPAIEAFGQVSVVDGFDIARVRSERRGFVERPA